MKRGRRLLKTGQEFQSPTQFSDYSEDHCEHYEWDF
jgi:hypothetical protein